METIKEDYVSFETAKLLKEKRFDAKCDKCYAYFTDDDIRWMGLSYPKSAQVLSENRYPCITLQMAMKWLREAHNIDIEVDADVGMLGVKVYTPFISRYKSSTEYPSKLRQYKNGLYFEDDRGVIPALRHFESYEEAVDAALIYCLKHLI